MQGVFFVVVFIVVLWISASLIVRRFRDAENAVSLSLCSLTAMALLVPAGPLLFFCGAACTTVFLAVVGMMAVLGV
jgi:uncharacterized membrane protein YhaH (DUF805 family)